MHMIEELEKLCHKAMESIAESNKKLEKDGERLNTSDAEYLAYLVKIVKSCKTIEAMEEYDDGYIKFSEIDICDVMFRFGIIGLVLFVDNLVTMPVKKLDSNEKIVLFLFLIISLTSGHVLLTPNVCIYIGLLFSKNVLE